MVGARHTDDGAHTSGRDNSAKDNGHQQKEQCARVASPSRPESRGDVGVYMHASNYTKTYGPRKPARAIVVRYHGMSEIRS